MKVLLEASAFGVLALDETVARGHELLGTDEEAVPPGIEVRAECGASQGQAGLRGESFEETLLDQGESGPRTLLEATDAEDLVTMAHRQGPQSLVGDCDVAELER